MCEISHFNHIQLFVTLWTIAHQAPLSMGFSRQEYLRGLPCSIPGDLPAQGSNPHLLHCRWIPYHWCYLGNPMSTIIHINSRQHRSLGLIIIQSFINYFIRDMQLKIIFLRLQWEKRIFQRYFSNMSKYSKIS